MNRGLFISVLAIFILVAGSVSIVSAYTVLDTATAIRAEGQIPFTPGTLLDNFNAGTTTNVWNCVTGTFVGAMDSTNNPIDPNPDTKCTASYTSDPGTNNGRIAGNCLKLDYNVNATNNYSGYYSRLYSGSPSQNLSGYTALSFYVKGASGREFFKIQFKKGDGTTASFYITDYLDGGLTTGWQKVTIPFHNFVNLGNVGSWGNMAEFILVFEQYSSDTNNSSPKIGTIYVDDIKFENIDIPAVRIDHFGDKLGTCALGGNMGTSDSNNNPDNKLITYSFSNATNEYSPSPYGMALNYNVSGLGAWASTYLIFGGGSTGWTAVPHDFSAYNSLSFKVRAKSDTENPVEMRIELVDNVGTKMVRVGPIPNSWLSAPSAISLDLFVDPANSANHVNKAAIKQLTFVFEGYRIGSAGGDKIGTVFIDSIEFKK